MWAEGPKRTGDYSLVWPPGRLTSNRGSPPVSVGHSPTPPQRERGRAHRHVFFVPLVSRMAMRGGINARRRPGATPHLDILVRASLRDLEDPVGGLPWIVSRLDQLFHNEVGGVSGASSSPRPTSVPATSSWSTTQTARRLLAIPDGGFDRGRGRKRIRVEHRSGTPGSHFDGEPQRTVSSDRDALGWAALARCESGATPTRRAGTFR